jgi:hypothetical protein
VTTILYLLTLSLAKISTLLLIARLTSVKPHMLLIRVVGAVVVLWTVASVFAVAFQCGVHRPWDYLEGKCFNRVSKPTAQPAQLITNNNLVHFLGHHRRD